MSDDLILLRFGLVALALTGALLLRFWLRRWLSKPPVRARLDGAMVTLADARDTRLFRVGMRINHEAEPLIVVAVNRTSGIITVAPCDRTTRLWTWLVQFCNRASP